MTDPFRDELQSALSPAYTIQRELSGGGMSRVFVALEHALGRTVVVKVLKPELGVGVNRERFRREIMLAAQLQHPHIVPVLNAGEHGDLLWYTMPFVEGVSLRDSLSHVGQFSPRTVMRVLHDVLDALAYAHRRGVIHRDIKPGNILHHGSHSLVTDFGVAKALSASLPHSGTTSVGIAIGTPAYMAPEQLAADPTANHRMDLYAVGLLAYELLTGLQPFSGSSPQATMAAQLTRMPAPLEESCPGVPPELSSLVIRLLAKHPDDRPQTAAAALAELENFTTPTGAPATAASLGATVAPVSTPAPSATPTPAITPPRRLRGLWAGLAAVAVVAITAAALIIGRRPNAGAVISASDSSSAARPAALGMKSDSSPSAAAATPNIRLTREDSLRIAAVVKAQLLKSMRGSPRQAGGVANVDSLQSVLMRAYTDSAIRHAREALRQAGLSEVAGLMAAESVAARLRDSRSHPPTGPSVGGPSRPPTPPRTSRLTTPAKKPPTFARPRRVAILPVRNGTQRPELAAMARMLTDSLRATLVAAGYTPVSDAELLQFLVSPDMSSQRRLADSLGVGAVITSFVSTRGDEALAQSLVLDVWRGIPVSVRAAADLDKPQDAVAVIRDVLRALERVSWRSRVDAKRVLVFDIDNQTGSDSLDNIARQLTTTLRTTIAERLGAIVAADSQSQATKDILERRSVGSRLGAGAIVAGSLYGARGETMIVRLSIRDMSDDRTLPNVDARIPRGATSEQLGPIVEAVIAQLGQINWGPRSDKK